MKAISAEIVKNLMANGFDTDQSDNRQVLTLAEEVGEFVGAYRRWSGQARRTDTFDHVTEELADVIITAYVTAHQLNINLDLAVHDKVQAIFTRGWREEVTNP
jgi:NTP pyrophosphatase (non-canonical NTP hydrolase)